MFLVILIGLIRSQQTIESVEQEVERLLEADNMASEVKYGQSGY